MKQFHTFSLHCSVSSMSSIVSQRLSSSNIYFLGFYFVWCNISSQILGYVFSVLSLWFLFPKKSCAYLVCCLLDTSPLIFTYVYIFYCIIFIYYKWNLIQFVVYFNCLTFISQSTIFVFSSLIFFPCSKSLWWQKTGLPNHSY